MEPSVAIFQANHTACGEAYSMSLYLFMNNMKSQMAEQLINNSLRKLSTFAAYSKILEVFITVRNLSVKNIVEVFSCN